VLSTIASSLIVLNLLIAVVVEAMDRMKVAELDEAIEEDRAIDERIIDELLALRAQVERLEQKVSPKGTGGSVS